MSTVADLHRLGRARSEASDAVRFRRPSKEVLLRRLTARRRWKGNIEDSARRTPTAG
jgi:hypothetical protein